MSTEKIHKILVPNELYELEQVDYLRGSINREIRLGAKTIELDFTKCRATSAYALNVLAVANLKIRESGGAVRITNLSPSLKEILENVAFDSLIPLSETST